MADIDRNKQASMPMTIVGGDEQHAADVILDEGVRKLAAKADVTVNSLRGFDPIADTWFFIGTEADSTGSGNIGDTIRVQIAAGDNLSFFPAVDVTTTITANEAGPGKETQLANLIASDLNADANFTLNYFARRIEDKAATVHITAKRPGPEGERPASDDFTVTTTGAVVITRAFDNIVRRQKSTSLARDPADPRLGVLGISGSVTAGQGDITAQIVEFATSGGSDSLLVNGSVTPVDFIINASATQERFFESLRFEAIGNGIQFTKFLSQNQPLTNGVEVTIRSNNSEVTFPLIKTTEDFASFFARGPSDFDFFDVSGSDYFRATLTFSAPFQLFKQGTFATDDFIRIRIQDNLATGISQFKFIGFGFEREF